MTRPPAVPPLRRGPWGLARGKGKRKRNLLWAAAIWGVPLIWSSGVAIAIVRAGAPNPDANGDVAIVLGAAVWDTEPSPVLTARIDHAIWLFEQGQVERLVFTGGRSEGDRLSEAEAARDFALGRGVPTGAIHLETTSTSTLGNLSNAEKIMKQLGVREAVIVSDPHHLLRAGMIADRVGIVHELSPTPTSRYRSFGTKASQVSREIYYITRLLLTGL